MTITKDAEKKPTGFETLDLTTRNEAELHARIDRDNDFEVSFEGADFATGWSFDEAGCQEAAVFFLHLAAEIERRESLSTD